MAAPPRTNRESLPRRLPLPPTPPPSAQRSDSKRASRPLPNIPRALVCKQCGTCITSHNVLFPVSSIPPDSRAFKGFSGKAALFTETYNIALAKPKVELMATGAHTMQEMTCSVCATYIGWKILRAHDKSESWKDGQFLLELEQLSFQPDAPSLPSLYNQPRRSTSSGSDTSEYSP